jgi:hypothetical protein
VVPVIVFPVFVPPSGSAVDLTKSGLKDEDRVKKSPKTSVSAPLDSDRSSSSVNRASGSDCVTVPSGFAPLKEGAKKLTNEC